MTAPRGGRLAGRVESSTAAAPEKAPSRFFVNGPVDFLFIGGFSVIAYVGVRLAMNQGWGGTRFDTVFGFTIIQFGIWLSWVVNWPHFAATAHRLYGSRDTARQYPVTAYVIPLLLAPATMAALFMPETFAPWLVKLFLVWSPYHFGGQTIGIALLYARRAGFTVTPFLRWSLTWFVFAVYIQLQARAEGVGFETTFFGISGIPSIGLPARAAEVAGWAMSAMAIALMLALVDASRRSGQTVPALMVVPVLAYFIWFRWAGETGFIEFVPLFHSVQYLYIAWFLRLRQRQVQGAQPGSVPFVIRETVTWWCTIGLLGAAMFALSPWLMSQLTVATAVVATGVMHATIQIHHFFVDGVIWKLRDERFKGLLESSVDDLTGKSRS